MRELAIDEMEQVSGGGHTPGIVDEIIVVGLTPIIGMPASLVADYLLNQFLDSFNLNSGQNNDGGGIIINGDHFELNCPGGTSPDLNNGHASCPPTGG